MACRCRTVSGFCRRSNRCSRFSTCVLVPPRRPPGSVPQRAGRPVRRDKDEAQGYRPSRDHRRGRRSIWSCSRRKANGIPGRCAIAQRAPGLALVENSKIMPPVVNRSRWLSWLRSMILADVRRGYCLRPQRPAARIKIRKLTGRSRMMRARYSGFVRR